MNSPTLPQVGDSASSESVEIYTPKALALPNLVTNTTTLLSPAPWEPGFTFPDPIAKSEYSSREAKSVFLSFVEGLVPTDRVTLSNPGRVIHGFIADYDILNTVEHVLERLTLDRTKPKSFKGTKPQWIIESASEKIKAVWLFEKAIDLGGHPAAAQAFYHQLSLDLRAQDLTYGYDKSCERGNLYQHIGVRWTPVADSSPVSVDILNSALVKATQKLFDKVKVETSDIPLEAINEEVHKHWPDAPEIAEGTHIGLFWLPEDDPSKTRAATVTQHGIVCYSDRSPVRFLSWSELLKNKNPNFVRNYSSRVVAGVLENCYYDERQYWWKNQACPRGWQPLNRVQVIDRLCLAGLSREIPKQAHYSQVQDAIVCIESNRIVGGAGPCHFDTRELVPHNGVTILNTAPRLPSWAHLEPDTALTPDRDFPFIWKFVYEMWDRPAGYRLDPGEYIVEWMRRDIAAIKAGRGMPSTQALIVAGESGLGKSFFINQILGRVYGRLAGASKFLSGNTNFNEDLVDSPLWVMDDTEATVDAKTRAAILGRIKESLAKGNLHFEGKFLKAFTLAAKPRIVIACNADEVSSAVIPSIGASTEDKFSYLLVRHDFRADFSPVEADNNNRVAQELPYFIQWMLSREAPSLEPRDKVSVRWGQKPFQHPDLVAASADTGFGMNDDEIATVGLRHIAAAYLPQLNGKASSSLTSDVCGKLIGDTVAFPWNEFESMLEGMGTLPSSAKRRLGMVSRKLTSLAAELRRKEDETGEPAWLLKERKTKGPLYFMKLNWLPEDIRYRDQIEAAFAIKDTDNQPF